MLVLYSMIHYYPTLFWRNTCIKRQEDVFCLFFGYSMWAAIPAISQINFVVTLWLYRRAGSISFVGNVLNFHCSLVEYSLRPGRTRRSIHQIWILRVDGWLIPPCPGCCQPGRGLLSYSRSILRCKGKSLFWVPNIHLTIIDLCLMWQCCPSQLDGTLS